MSRWIGGDGAAPTCELVMQGSAYGASVDRQSSGSSFQSSSLSFGSAHPTRTLAVVIVIAGDYSTDIPDTGVLQSLTIDGDAPSIAKSVFAHTDGSSAKYTQIVIAYLRQASKPSGVISWAAEIALNSNSRSFCGIYSCKFLHAAPIMIAGSDQGAHTPHEIELADLPGHSVVIGCGIVPTDIAIAAWGLSTTTLDADGPASGAAYLPSVDMGSGIYAWFAHRVVYPSGDYEVQWNCPTDGGARTISSAVSLR